MDLSIKKLQVKQINVSHSKFIKMVQFNDSKVFSKYVCSPVETTLASF